MRDDLKTREFFWLSILFVISFGCQSIQSGIPSKQSQMEYLDVDYRRFVSGVYVDELANKYVKLNCSFSSTMAGILPGGYSSARYMAFQVVSPSGHSMETPGMLTVVVPKDIADVVFTLRHGDGINVYGQAVPAVTSVVSTL